MEKYKQIYYAALTAVSIGGSGLASLLGGFDYSLQALCLVMAIDYITGILCALIWNNSPKSEDGKFESKASIKGLFRKMAYLACVLVAVCLEKLMGITFIRDGVIIFFIANDGFSIIENLGIMGVPFPQKLKNAFALLKDKSEE